MIYNTPTRGDDGMYHVKAITDEKKRCFVQLSNVKVTEVDNDSGEVSFEVTDEDNQAKLNIIHVSNLQSAVENAKEWFGKELSDKTINNAYAREGDISADKIEATRIFDSEKQVVDFEKLEVGMTCSIFVEFSGLWFAKKAFGPSWNLVQVKIHEDEKPPEETEPEIEAYPDQYMFEDEVSK
tara:strand:- start:3441 stop:3986 length:546 start_codon:yes stop_codon:yes gene_type:complete